MPNILDSLPNIVREHLFAQILNLAAHGLTRMSAEGTLPLPFALDQGKPVWMEDAIEEWFSHIQPNQAAYASIGDELGVQELTQGLYVCPARSSYHIGQRRPSTLVLHERGALRNANNRYVVRVFDVESMQTQDGVMGEELITYKNQTASLIPWGTIRPASDELLTVFKLDMGSVRTLEIDRVWQRGGTLSQLSLQGALATGHATHFKGGLAHL